MEVIGNGYFSNGLRVYGSGNEVSGSDAVLYVGKPNNNDWAIMLDHYNSDYGLKINGNGPHMIGFYHRNSMYSRINSYGQIERFRPNAGYFIGKTNSSYETNPIYTRSIYYRPGETKLENMYGIGYSYGGNASFLPSYFRYGNGWGMYVAAGGAARIFLDGSRGDVNCTGAVYCGNFLRTRGATGWLNETYKGGWYMVDSTWGKGKGQTCIYRLLCKTKSWKTFICRLLFKIIFL